MIMNILAASAASTASAAENLRENILRSAVIAEIGKAGVAGVGRPATLIGKIPIILLAWPLRARRVDFSAIETRALVRIAQEIIGGRNFLEFFFSRLVARIEVRVKLFRQPAIGLLNLVLRGLFLYAQRCVGVRGQCPLLSARR